MTDNEMRDYLQDHIREARTRGVACPVLLVLSTDSAHAQAVHTALHGREMDPPPDAWRHELGVVEGVAIAQAADLLRRHGDAGGAAVAEHLEDDTVAAESWVVILTQQSICAAARRGDRNLIEVVLDYDRVSRSCRTPGKIIDDPGPSTMNLKGDDGQVFSVFGRSGVDTAMAAALVSLCVAHPGATEFRHPAADGAAVRVYVTPELVKSFLTDVYSDQPHQVAEAVRRLRRTDAPKAAWLMRLMRNSPGLVPLYRNVRYELDGVEP